MEYKITNCTTLEHGTLLHTELGKMKENSSRTGLELLKKLQRREGIVCVLNRADICTCFLFFSYSRFSSSISAALHIWQAAFCLCQEYSVCCVRSSVSMSMSLSVCPYVAVI